MCLCSIWRHTRKCRDAEKSSGGRWRESDVKCRDNTSESQTPAPCDCMRLDSFVSISARAACSPPGGTVSTFPSVRLFGASETVCSLPQLSDSQVTARRTYSSRGDTQLPAELTYGPAACQALLCHFGLLARKPAGGVVEKHQSQEDGSRGAEAHR